MINVARKAANPAFLKWLKNTLTYGISGKINPKKGELATALGFRVVPDAIGGVMIGASTPGDLGDKIIAGTTDTAFGVLGGVGLSGAARPLTRGSQLGSITTDLIGSYAGFNAAMPVSESLLKAKDKLQGGEGLSPYEKLDDQRRKEIELDLLNRLGLA